MYFQDARAINVMLSCKKKDADDTRRQKLMAQLLLSCKKKAADDARCKKLALLKPQLSSLWQQARLQMGKVQVEIFRGVPRSNDESSGDESSIQESKHMHIQPKPTKKRVFWWWIFQNPVPTNQELSHIVSQSHFCVVNNKGDLLWEVRGSW